MPDGAALASWDGRAAVRLRWWPRRIGRALAWVDVWTLIVTAAGVIVTTAGVVIAHLAWAKPH